MTARTESSTGVYLAIAIWLSLGLMLPSLWKKNPAAHAAKVEYGSTDLQQSALGRMVAKDVATVHIPITDCVYEKSSANQLEVVPWAEHEHSSDNQDRRPFVTSDSNNQQLIDSPSDKLSFNRPPSHPTVAFAASYQRKVDSTEEYQEGQSLTINRNKDDSAADNSSPWFIPERLEQKFKNISDVTKYHDWCLNILTQLHDLAGTPSLDAVRARTALVNLRNLAHQGRYHIIQTPYGDPRTELTQTVYALERRLFVWECLHEVALLAQEAQPHQAATISDTFAQVAVVEKELGHSGTGERWSRYLLLENVQNLAVLNTDALVEPQSKLAVRILGRIHASHLTAEQQNYLQAEPVQALAESLRSWVGVPVDYPDLLTCLERYEVSQRAPDGQVLADVTRHLQWSDNDKVTELGNVLERHWRNANIRVALSAELMNRYLPEPQVTQNQVQELLSGTTIRGTSQTMTKFRWNLIPDPRRIHLELEAKGVVRSETTASQGIARTRNQGDSNFKASKPIMLDTEGLHVKEAVASAEATINFVELQTEYDGIPLIGAIARSTAQSRINEQRSNAQSLTKQRVSGAVKQNLDDAFQSRMEELRQKLDEGLIAPLHQIGLELSPVSLQTTAQRVIARYRLAGSNQLAAHTPRPIAPTNSVLSVQFHQSTLNNLVQKFELDGKTFELEELYRYLPQKLGQEPESIPQDLPANVCVRFANYEPIRFDFSDNRVRVTLRLTLMSKGRRHRWRCLTVRADYQPDPSSVEACLARNESIRLSGSRLDFSDQVALRGIFSRVFSRKRKYPILQQHWAEQPPLRELRISQFVVRDGWIGVAWTSPRMADISQNGER